ncbi:MAG: hypothetical protein HN725_22470 [Alphaproteobacteria bacterium]|jgi:hypothetical protein|nr:hypothetical protein [Alphaproteobacteria bacterium]
MTMISDLIANPVVQSAVIPFVCSLAIAGLMLLNDGIRERFSGMAVLTGFVLAYIVIFDFPPLPPKSSGQKILYVTVLGAAVGLYLDMFKRETFRIITIALLLCLATVIWIGWRKVSIAPSVDHLSLILLMSALSVVVILTEKGRLDGTDEAVPLLATSIVIAGLATMGASASIGQNGGALAAALGGILVLNWPKRHFPPGITSRVLCYATLAALLSQLVFFTKAPVWTMTFILPVFYAGRFFDRLNFTSVRLNRSQNTVMRPMFIGVCGAALGAIVLGLAWFDLPSDPYAS